MRPRSGFVIYQLSGQLHRGSSPLPKSSNIEKAARGFPFSFKPYPEARPGFHVLIPAFLPFLRLWRPLSGAAAYSFYNNSFDIYYYI